MQILIYSLLQILFWSPEGDDKELHKNMKAEHKAILMAVVAALAIMYVVANFTDQDMCNNFGLTSHKSA